MDYYKLSAVALEEFRELTADTYGMDSLNECHDKIYFKNYPESVHYRFNEIGFRERSISQYNGTEILAIGDSFTVGLGLAENKTWPRQLENIVNYPVLNFGLNGASNNWIAKKCLQLLEYFDPPYIVVHWTFSHRREHWNSSWTDVERMLHYTETTVDNCLENWENWKKCATQVENNPKKIPVVHSMIHNWHDGHVDFSEVDFAIPVIPPLNTLIACFPGFSASFNRHAEPYIDNEMISPDKIKTNFPKLTDDQINMLLSKLEFVDLARDGFHYGPATCNVLANKIAQYIKLP